MFVQLRLASKAYPFVLRGERVSAKIDPTKLCECCNMKSNETLEHMLFVCPQYAPWRRNLLNEHLIEVVGEHEDMILILRDPSEEIIDAMFKFISCALKHRDLICNM